ncbi:hypothetical protein TRFO_27695 [Tritrichomonas foetus]|uniref:Protein kinase domain-containing protein n=1 Tax=Tritrichomonas foetus TaxID=1144522 RepID=A0A1J4JZV7_9EUKA|nr:hypothetical protein TRFO_27695 [Tritrichomonas foetus]|eukprot:OHT04697.1 hypothetical protein TRFO_27695 [Tritrichomonas foetus]
MTFISMDSGIKLSDYLIDLDNYTLGEKLGKGGCGTVFKAIDKTTKQEVAIKFIHKTDKMNDKKEQMNLLREITVPCRLDLPGIVHLIGFRFPLSNSEKPARGPTKVGADEPDLDGAVIVTELMKNTSLNNIIKDYLDGKPTPKFGPTERSKIIFGIAQTMALVHAKDIIHRDLKLENVFLDDNYEPRIADFGLAKTLITGIEMTMTIGTPLYMAPELFMDGDETYDGKVDVYAFGILLYKMFENKLQLDDKKPIRSPQQLMMRIGKGCRPIKTPAIPDHYWEIITKCWDKDPEARPTFQAIVNILKQDKYALEEKGVKTDMAAFNEYKERVSKTDLPDDALGKSFSRTFGKSMMLKSMYKPREDDKPRKTKFIWRRH